MIPGKSLKISSLLGFVILVMLPLTSAFVHAKQKDLDQIRQAIKAKGAKWHADETSISVLSEKEKKMRLGTSEYEDFLAESLSSDETAPIPVITGSPATVDWRNVEGTSYVTPIKNQGSCGSCWAFATTAGAESQVMLSSGGMPIDLSEQILVSCSGSGSCSGGSSSTASSFIRDVGLPLETCLRYTATNNLCSNACLNWEDSTYKINGWHRASTSGSGVDAMRNAVYAYGPFIATMYVYNDFFSYRSGVYSYATGSYAGAHAVLVVGYDDTQQAFIVKNSWGSGWGEAGFFMIAYSEVSGTSKFGYSTMVYDGYGVNPTPDPTPTPDPGPQPCSYSLSSSGATFKADGGTGSFTLYAQGSCSLSSVTPASSADWVTITSTSDANNGVTVYYSVDGNTDAARAATIDIADQTYSVKQLQARTSRGKKSRAR
jgi:C1A family cysteine protease